MDLDKKGIRLEMGEKSVIDAAAERIQVFANSTGRWHIILLHLLGCLVTFMTCERAHLNTKPSMPYSLFSKLPDSIILEAPRAWLYYSQLIFPFTKRPLNSTFYSAGECV